MAKKEAAKAQEGKTVELPTAEELMQQIAQKEAEKAAEYMRRQVAAEAEKKALIERLTKPSGVSDEEMLHRAMVIIQRASSNGLTEVQMLRFPNSLCTDGGRAINNRWVQRFREDGVCEPMPRGGSTSPLEKYSQQILVLIREQRDLTLNEIVSLLHRRRIPGSRSALSRFFARHGITFKKKPAGGRAQASRRGSRAPTLDSRARLA